MVTFFLSHFFFSRKLTIFFYLQDIACDEGQYLPFGELDCAPCPPGTYSIGGGVRQLDWNAQTFPHYEGVFFYKTSCTNDRSKTVIPCPDG